MARVKRTGPNTPSSSESLEIIPSPSHSSSATPSPQTSPLPKRISKPTAKVQTKDKDKGKGPMVEQEKKRKAPPKEKLMKDAMKSSSVEPKAKKAKKSSTSTPKDDDLTDLIPDAEGRASFIANFASKKIHDARVVDFAYFDQNGFVFQDHLRHYGMIPFLTTQNEYYPRLIRIFYYNFKLLKTGFVSEVKGKKISMTFQEFSTFSGLPYYGDSIDGRVTPDAEEYVWEEVMVRATAVRELMVDGFVETTSLPVGQMKVQHRLLLYVLSRILYPRTGNYAVVQQIDITLLWGMINELPMSWTYIVLVNMRDATSTSMLPYPQLITRLLRKFKVSVAGEEKKTTNHIFGEATINQMQLKKVAGIWTRAANAENAAPLEPNEIMAKLLELIASQASHNAKVESSLTQITAQNAQIISRLETIEHNVHAIQEHLSLQVSFDDIANIGQEAVQSQEAGLGTENPAPLVDGEPHGEETHAEANTAVSPSSLANNEGHDQV